MAKKTLRYAIEVSYVVPGSLDVIQSAFVAPMKADDALRLYQIAKAAVWREAHKLMPHKENEEYAEFTIVLAQAYYNDGEYMLDADWIAVDTNLVMMADAARLLQEAVATVIRD